MAFFFTSVTFAEEPQIELRIMETTDIHAHVMDYNYFRDAPVTNLGLVRTASLIKEAREEVVNHVLVDNGDLIQGGVMGDYVADKGLGDGDIHPVYKVMNRLEYDVGNVGNHEFNFGLDFLHDAINGADFPYISANVVDADTGEPVFEPYVIKEHRLSDTLGTSHAISIGYIGFVPPQIMTWDRQHLKGRVEAEDITHSARRWVPRMEEEGVDLVIAIPHSGLSSEPYRAMAENSVYYLSEVPGIDAIAFGHAHAVFPDEEFVDIPGVDVAKGTINDVVAVMPGRWGSHLGIMDLVIERQEDQWEVVSAQSEARPIYDRERQEPLVKRQNRLAERVTGSHEATRDFVNRSVGEAPEPIYSYLALVQNDPSVAVVNRAQKAYVEHYTQGDPDLEQLPVLSVTAPFKAGGRKDSPNDYVTVEAGTLTYGNAADLYPFPNTLVALTVTGVELREWLECSAALFNRIDPDNAEVQSLINWDDFRVYNFDVIHGLEYEIDVTRPARYDGDCELLNPDAQRITDVRFEDKPLDDEASFLLATNNYRAFGEVFPGTGETNVAFEAPDQNRSIVSEYIRRRTDERGHIDAGAEANWRFAPIENATSLLVTFETSPHESATAFTEEFGRYPMTRLGTDSVGFAVYSIDLQSPRQP